MYSAENLRHKSLTSSFLSSAIFYHTLPASYNKDRDKNRNNLE
jgi:hypothetical protein